MRRPLSHITPRVLHIGTTPTILEHLQHNTRSFAQLKSLHERIKGERNYNK